MVSDIIELLSSEDELTKPLLKTLVFSKRIENEELSDWLMKELNGYGNDDTLPDYRFARTTLQCVLKQNGQNTKSVALPLSCFNQDTRDVLMKKPFGESVSALEAVLSNKNNQYIGKNFAADMLQSLSNEAKKNGHNFTVVSCQQTVSIIELRSILISVRTKLLDLLLKLEKETIDPQSLSTNNKLKSEINTTINYFMNEIYNIKNDGNDNIINTGNNNKIAKLTNYPVNDFKGLEAFLLHKGISQLDTEEIIKFINKKI